MIYVHLYSFQDYIIFQLNFRLLLYQIFFLNKLPLMLIKIPNKKFATSTLILKIIKIVIMIAKKIKNKRKVILNFELALVKSIKIVLINP